MYENVNPYELEKKDIVEELFYIYFLFNENNEIIYIGQSESLYYRIHCHLKSIKGIKKIAFFQTCKEEANNAEAYLIVKYMPIFNRSIPQNDIYISLRGFKKISSLYGIKELEVDEFMQKNGVKEINKYVKKEELKEIFVLHNQKNFGVENDRG